MSAGSGAHSAIDCPAFFAKRYTLAPQVHNETHVEVDFGLARVCLLLRAHDQIALDHPEKVADDSPPMVAMPAV
eukprot:SAG31_NODE_25462_length_461_cov_0.613260_1_plen_73_part_10